MTAATAGVPGVKTLIGRNPTLWIAVISNAIILAGTLGFRLLDPTQAGLVVAVIDAIALAVNAYTVRPIAPAAFTYAVGAVVALLGAYGYQFTADQVAGVNGLVVTVLALLTYGNVSPQETAISKA